MVVCREIFHLCVVTRGLGLSGVMLCHSHHGVYYRECAAHRGDNSVIKYLGEIESEF